MLHGLTVVTQVMVDPPHGEIALKLERDISEVRLSNQRSATNNSFFKIIPVAVSAPYPKFGSAKGLVNMAEDFDEPLEDFQAYTP